MATETPRFKFTMFGSVSDTLDYRSYKFTKADRILLDRLLTHAAENHRHDGTTGATTQDAAPGGPRLMVMPTGGGLPASTAAYYRISVVDPKGQEHLASQPAVATTSQPVDTPHPPLLQRGPGVGVLLPGDYMYAVSAYTHETGQETEASRPANSNIDIIGGFTLFMPTTVPSGADGWNIYRKGPTDGEQHYITSIARDATFFQDTGAIAANPLRVLPTTNTTNGRSAVQVDLPDGVPEDHTVRVYRTFNPTSWDNSLLTWTATLPIIDGGQATKEGSPPSVSQAVSNPPKVRLGTETQGTPPPALVPTTTVVTFAFPGPVAVGDASWQWISEFNDAITLSIRAALGRGATPAARPVVVALERRATNTVLWHRFQTAGGADLLTHIPVGEQTSPLVAIPPDAIPGTRLLGGFALRPVILQNGGGATPTDHDLLVTVTLAVRHGSATTTYTWET